MVDKNSQAILYVVTNTKNNLKYYGIIFKKDKTIEQRLNDHITGKGAGKFLHKAIALIGAEAFSIMEIEKGPLEYIAQREMELTSTSLWHKGEGYNGNCGRCIIFDDEMMKQKFINTNQIERVKRWKDTYNRNRHLHNYNRGADFKTKQEINNWSKRRGKTKENSESLRKLSDSIRQRWKTPTEEMLKGIIKGKTTIANQSQEIKTQLNIKRNESRKKRKIEKGFNYSWMWQTPHGMFNNITDASIFMGISISALRSWCLKNKQILKHHHKDNEKILPEWDLKFSTDIGFKKIKNDH